MCSGKLKNFASRVFSFSSQSNQIHHICCRESHVNHVRYRVLYRWGFQSKASDLFFAVWHGCKIPLCTGFHRQLMRTKYWEVYCLTWRYCNNLLLLKYQLFFNFKLKLQIQLRDQFVSKGVVGCDIFSVYIIINNTLSKDWQLLGWQSV